MPRRVVSTSGSSGIRGYLSKLCPSNIARAAALFLGGYWPIGYSARSFSRKATDVGYFYGILDLGFWGYVLATVVWCT